MSAGDAQVLEHAARILERDACGNERFPTDRCTCGHDRSEHLGREIGCVGSYTWPCDCRRFTLDIEASTNMIGLTHRNAIQLLRRVAVRPPSEGTP